MTKITLAFTAPMRVAISQGRKCCTSRETRHGEVGDIFFVGYQAYRLTHILPMYADTIAKELYGAEGFSSSELFIAWWNTHKGRFDPDKTLYVHFFAAVLPVVSEGFTPEVKA